MADRPGRPSRTVTAIALGDQHGLALLDDGTIRTWGNAYQPRQELNEVVAISAGSVHSLALLRNGTVAGWGHSGAGQADVPENLSDVVAIAAGGRHSLALRSDGTVVGWGANDDGQTEPPYYLRDATAIAAGSWHSLALRSDGSVVAWGHPDSDQRHVPFGLSGVVAISAGYENSSAVLADGSVVDWGNDHAFMRVPDSFRDVKSVTYGWKHRLAILGDGTVVSDGGWAGGFPVPADLEDVVAIAGATMEGSHNSFVALIGSGTIVVLKNPSIDYMAQQNSEMGLLPRRWPALEVPADLTGAEAHDQLDSPRDEATSTTEFRDQGAQHDEPDAVITARSLLHWSAVGDEAQVRSLLDNGADLGAATDEDGDGVLRYAMGTKSAGLFSLLLGRGADANSPSTGAAGEPGLTILHAVAGIDWAEGIRLLVANGAEVDSARDIGITPMMLAAGAGCDASVAALADLGADIDACDDEGDSVLFYAASKGRRTTVEGLLELGANCDTEPGDSGHTPLTIAAQMASPLGQRLPDVPSSEFARIVVQLLRAGADPGPMYDAGLVLVRGGETAPRRDVSSRVKNHDHWAVAYLTPEGRAQAPWLEAGPRHPKTPGSVTLRKDEPDSYTFAPRDGIPYRADGRLTEMSALVQALRNEYDFRGPLSTSTARCPADWDSQLAEAVASKRQGNFFDSAATYVQLSQTSGVVHVQLLLGLYKTVASAGDVVLAYRLLGDIERIVGNESQTSDHGARMIDAVESEHALVEYLRDINGNASYKLPRAYPEILGDWREYQQLVRDTMAKLKKIDRGGCYIATAVYGSYDATPVLTLRRFRDRVLARSPIGRIAIRTYYAISPPLARHFVGASALNRCARTALDALVRLLDRRGYGSE
ncbi:ankyrin repeat domain-containing protein [Microbacterium sp. zg.B48]|uniref:CFI-box-CTERM domain-containing protein n=1 Tax=Microbacterium sp. zg.B48 TaxID=2969408 RepID=UPI00214CBE20|nr:CFI-box-CTERM domain-containing protein [Microbacterium sp. zg.B48]MCR2763833.1 ankyrin repeat domain-containing protein [Microbacterium sp. zg.B48]